MPRKKIQDPDRNFLSGKKLNDAIESLGGSCIVYAPNNRRPEQYDTYENEYQKVIT